MLKEISNAINGKTKTEIIELRTQIQDLQNEILNLNKEIFDNKSKSERIINQSFISYRRIVILCRKRKNYCRK